MSPRAACRLATMGYERVYDYVAGKVDWLAHGLRTEGENASEPRAGQHLVHDVVLAQLRDRIGHVAERVQQSPYGFALVVSHGGVLLGRLRKAALDGDPGAVAEAVMEPGPSTVRPDTSLAKLVQRMQEAHVKTTPVSTPEGVFVGLLRREHAEAVLGAGRERPPGGAAMTR